MEQGWNVPPGACLSPPSALQRGMSHCRLLPQHQPLVLRGPAQCWGPPWGGRGWGAAGAGGVQRAKPRGLLQCCPWSTGISSGGFILPQIPLTSPQQSNAISQGRNTGFPESRAGRWSPPFHGSISGAPGRCQAGDLAETSGGGELLLPIASIHIPVAVGFSCQEKPSRTFLSQGAESERAIPDPRGSPHSQDLQAHTVCAASILGIP